MELTRIEYELRALAVNATLRSSAAKPTPDELQMWCKDLRRGRMSVGGSVIRFLNLIKEREMGAEGRRIAQEVNRLLEKYIDILLPADAPKAEAVNKYEVDISSETRKVRLAHAVNYGRTNRSA